LSVAYFITGHVTQGYIFIHPKGLYPCFYLITVFSSLEAQDFV
jgi:hypothetical protein